MTKTLKGIDVSEHQGMITWSLVKGQISFVIIRAGYGKGHVDKQFRRNVSECIKYDIPFGIYWFSYALSKEDAVAEAEYCCELLNGIPVKYPVAFDWEYDSDNHAQKYGVLITNSIRQNIANAFLTTVKSKGYKPMLYTNADYLNKGFDVFLNTGMDIWYANWSTSVPAYTCKIWQYSAAGKITGITGNVDMNIMYETALATDTIDDWCNDNDVRACLILYNDLAESIIAGRYGTGLQRVELVKADGYDPMLAQKIVNYKMKHR